MLDRIRAALSSPDWLRRGCDFLIASVLFRLPVWMRRCLFLGNAHICPVCHARLRGFLELHRPYLHWCPICKSLQRHRLIGLMFDRGVIPATALQRVLHLAPEPGIAARLREQAQLYVSADRYDPHVQVQIDIVASPFAEHSFSLVICSHVLEHIPNDRAAMREIWRMLAPGGVALVIVPLHDSPTFEDPSITDPTERERIFGQFDHVRWYGLDIRERLEQVGFVVTQLPFAQLADQDDQKRYGLRDEGPFFLCRPAP